jgi:hypothetical protein
MKKIILALTMLFLLNVDARACSCQFTPLAERVSEADEIFFATLLRAEIKPGDYPEKSSYLEGTFQSRIVLKGAVSTKEIVLSTGTGNSGCNVPMFVSARYIVFKMKNQQSIETCMGSSVIEDFQQDEIEAKIKAEIKRQRAKSHNR